jgi:hypothetical protein
VVKRIPFAPFQPATGRRVTGDEQVHQLQLAVIETLRLPSCLPAAAFLRCQSVDCVEQIVVCDPAKPSVKRPLIVSLEAFEVVEGFRKRFLQNVLDR